MTTTPTAASGPVALPLGPVHVNNGPVFVSCNQCGGSGLIQQPKATVPGIGCWGCGGSGYRRLA